MAIVGTYSGQPGASQEQLRQAILGVLQSGAAGASQEQLAEQLAAAIAGWLATVPVVVQVLPADVGLQSTTTPGTPTGPPAVPMELAGRLLVAGGVG